MKGIAWRRSLSFVACAVGLLLCQQGRAEQMISGRVVAPDGKPVAGARMSIYYFHDPFFFGARAIAEATSGEDGAFVIREPDFQPPAVLPRFHTAAGAALRGIGRYLVGEHPDFALGIADVVPGRTEGYVVRLGRGWELVCRVLDRAGAPVADAEITVQSPRDITPCGAYFDWANRLAAVEAIVPRVCAAKSDGNGLARLRQLPAGVVSAMALKRGVGMGMKSLARAGGELTVTLDASGDRITGRVVANDTGAPLAGMVVWGPWGSGITSTLTDADGRYELWPWRAPPGTAVTALDPSPDPAYAPVEARLPDRRGEGGEIQLADIALPAGKKVFGRVVRAGTAEAVPGAIVGAWTMEKPSSTLFRVTDARGRFSFRLATARAQAQVFLHSPPPGYADLARGSGPLVDLKEPATEVTFTASIRPVPRRAVLVRGPGGEPAGGARLAAFQLSDARAGVAGADGYTEVVGFRADPPAPLHLYATAGDQAAYAVLPPGEQERPEPLELVLRPTREVEVLLQDERKRDVEGWIYLCLLLEGRIPFRITEITRVPGAGAGLAPRVRVLPTTDYVLHGYARGMPGWQKVPLRVAAEGPVAPQVLAVKGVLAPSGLRTEDDFKRELESLKDARWKKDDPVQPHLTWYAVPQGLVLADSQQRQIRRFTGLLGEEKFVATCLSFAWDKVWVGTDKGLFAWDRKDQFWARFAIGGTLVDVPVADAIVGEDGLLEVTVRPADGAARRFRYDPTARQWTELH